MNWNCLNFSLFLWLWIAYLKVWCKYSGLKPLSDTCDLASFYVLEMKCCEIVSFFWSIHLSQRVCVFIWNDRYLGWIKWLAPDLNSYNPKILTLIVSQPVCYWSHKLTIGTANVPPNSTLSVSSFKGLDHLNIWSVKRTKYDLNTINH